MNQHQKHSVLFRWPEVVLPGNFRSGGLLRKKKSFADALQFEQSSGRIVALDKKAVLFRLSRRIFCIFFFSGHINCKSFISWRASINIHQFDYAPVDLSHLFISYFQVFWGDVALVPRRSRVLQNKAVARRRWKTRVKNNNQWIHYYL